MMIRRFAVAALAVIIGAAPPAAAQPPPEWRERARALMDLTPPAAAALAERAAAAGSGRASLALAQIYAGGRGLAPNLPRSMSYLMEAAERGLPEAARLLQHLGVPDAAGRR